MTLDTLVVAFQQGATAEEIAQQYPTVPLPDIYAVITYYLRHREEVQAYLEEGICQADAARQEQEEKLICE